jgi:hypothetical protein
MTDDDAKDRRVGRQRKRALHLAGTVLDGKADRSASSKNQSARKQRLLDGPAEFTAVRVDRSKKTPNDAE